MSEFDVSYMIVEKSESKKLMTTKRNLEYNVVWLYDLFWHASVRSEDALRNHNIQELKVNGL